MIAVVGFAMMGVFATVSSLVQLIVTEEMRGRVMSVYNCAFRGGMPMGNLVSGWLIPMVQRPARARGERSAAGGAGVVLPAGEAQGRGAVGVRHGFRLLRLADSQCQYLPRSHLSS